MTAVLLATSVQAKPEIGSYQGLRANVFMKSWLVLGAIPVSQEKEPDGEIQKKAFASDLLAEQGGETGIQPQPGLRHKISGKDYQWKPLLSDHDIVDLAEPYGKAEFVVAYAWAEIVVPATYDYGASILTVTREGDRLFAQLAAQPKFEIFPQSETEFFWKIVRAEITFVKNEKGEVTGAIHHQGGQTIRAPRLEKEPLAGVDPALFEAYVGKYDFGQGKTILTVTKEGDRLLAQLTGQPKFEIFPKSETEFFWRVVPAHSVFVKDEKGEVAKGIFQQAGQTIEAAKVE